MALASIVFVLVAGVYGLAGIYRLRPRRTATLRARRKSLFFQLHRHTRTHTMPSCVFYWRGAAAAARTHRAAVCLSASAKQSAIVAKSRVFTAWGSARIFLSHDHERMRQVSRRIRRVAAVGCKAQMLVLWEQATQQARSLRNVERVVRGRRARAQAALSLYKLSRAATKRARLRSNLSALGAKAALHSVDEAWWVWHECVGVGRRARQITHTWRHQVCFCECVCVCVRVCVCVCVCVVCVLNRQ